MAFENLFIRTKRTIGTIQLDTIVTEEHDSSVTITKNPVEAGADITDHAIIQPKILFVRGAVTDTPLGSAAFGLLVDSITGLFGTSTSSNVTRSQQAYSAMELLMESREPIEVSTKLKTYSNMLITNIKTSQDKDTSRIAIMDITFEEIILTESVSIDLTESDVDDSVGKNLSTNVDAGRQEAITPSQSENSSLLSTLTNWLGE